MEETWKNNLLVYYHITIHNTWIAMKFLNFLAIVDRCEFLTSLRVPQEKLQ
jgi:hypothetical protein